MSPLKKLILSLLILFHLTTMAAWILPDSYIKRALIPLMCPYVICIGVWQVWGLFAPDPSNLNLYIHARVYHTDGSCREYTLPRVEQLGFLERYEQARWWMYIQNVHLDDHSLFWPDLSRWIRRQDSIQTGKTTAGIRLYRSWWWIPPPPKDTTRPAVPCWQTYMFYSEGKVILDPLRLRHPG